MRYRNRAVRWLASGLLAVMAAVMAVSGDQGAVQTASAQSRVAPMQTWEPLGPEGLALTCDTGTWVARPGAVEHGNPTGAGDAVTAALARGLLHGRPWPDVVVDAVALSAAAVLAPYAGEVDLRDLDRVRASVVLDRLDVTA